MEVLTALDSSPSISPQELQNLCDPEINRIPTCANESTVKPKLFVATVSQQVRASLAATYGTSEKEAGWLIDNLLSGPNGLAAGGKYHNGFPLVLDANAMREVALVMGAEEVTATTSSIDTTPVKKPVLTSACPGWVCYAEKNNPHVLPHMSRMKSPQALTGTLLKTVLSKKLRIKPEQIWHLAIMPCFDKKLEASRSELTTASWQTSSSPETQKSATRDVDCVITAREILMLAESRGISYPNLPKKPLNNEFTRGLFDGTIADFLFPSSDRYSCKRSKQKPEAGSSGGFLYHVLRTQQQLHPGTEIRSQRGRNADVVEYTVAEGEKVVFRAARYYGFRNIQNLVRKLRPAKESKLGKKAGGAQQPVKGKSGSHDYAYVEVMACPGGCTNGGGQIKIDDLGPLQGRLLGSKSQRDWLSVVDEAYYSMEDGETEDEDGCDGELTDEEDFVDGISASRVKSVLKSWEDFTGISLDKLLWTTFREVHSNVGNSRESDTERVAEVAARLGGGW